MKIGYARVSTHEQNVDLQVEALRRVGCEEIFTDKISGVKEIRPGLTKAFLSLARGDTLVVWKLDRLGRSMKRLVDLIEGLQKEGINFFSITDSIDTESSSGRFFFHVMAALAQMERELIIERTKAGLEAARLAGRKGGRKPVMNEKKISLAKMLLARDMKPQEIADELGISVSSFYSYFPRKEKKSERKF